MKNTLVISAFPATGKTHAYKILKEQGYDVLDSDSERFHWEYFFGGRYRNEEFPSNYVDYIRKNIGKVDAIFVSSHIEVRNALSETVIDYIVICPAVECKDTYVGRCYIRGNSKEFIDKIIENWDEWIACCENDTGANKIIELKHNEYLLDVIGGLLH